MEEIIARVAGAAGIDTELASKAVGMILGFLQKEGPPDAMGQMLGAMPGAEDLIAQAQGGGGGGGLMGMVGGLMGGMGGGGGVMGLGAQLMGAGLGMGEIQTVGRELFAIGRENVGEEVMGQIIGKIPGLSQFV